MTDDLVKRLRWKAGAYAKQAADRIEALEQELSLADDQRRKWEHHCKTAEARLAKAVEALRTIVDSYEATSELHTSSEDLAANLYDHARAVLAEIGGEA